MTIIQLEYLQILMNVQRITVTAVLRPLVLIQSAVIPAPVVLDTLERDLYVQVINTVSTFLMLYVGVIHLILRL